MIFAVCGGDERLARLARLLLEDGHRVRVFALEGAPLPEGARGCAAAAEAVSGADCAVLPLPADDGIVSEAKARIARLD